MKYILIILLLLIPTALAQERGIYVYDDANKITTESELGLSAYLWKMDVKTGYETVVVFPKQKMDIEQMATWFNSHGVGKEDKGLALFIFPDNTAFGMIGRGQDRIAVPYLTTYGKRTLSNLSEEPVVSVLGFLNAMNKKIDEPTTTEQAVNVGKKIAENLDLILLGFLTLSLFILLLEQRDGFQWEDLTIPCILFVVLVFFLGITYMASDMSSSVSDEYGVISSTHHGSYTFTRTHSCGKDCTYVTYHTMYTNEVGITSYDFREYKYKFYSEDSKSSWNIKEDDKVQISISSDNELWGATTYINDNSGGQTDRYGTWIQTK